MDKRDSIISVVTTPLGFFALSLLIVEGFLGIVVIGSKDSITPDAKLYGMYMAIAAFVLVVLVVTWMVWKMPENLTLSGKDWLERARESPSWGDSSDPSTKKEISDEEKSES